MVKFLHEVIDFLIVGDLPIASKRADPVLVVGFEMSDEVGIVCDPRIEEVGVPADTYLFFEFGNDLPGEIVLALVVFIIFVEAESKRVGGFVIGIEGVDDVLTPDSRYFPIDRRRTSVLSRSSR